MSNERDREDLERIHQNHAQLMNQLPKANGWFHGPVFLYKGYWLSKHPLLGVMLMQNHYKPQSTDIFISSFMKSGTTWLKALLFSILNRSRFDFSDHPLLRQGPHECVPVLDYYICQDYPITNLEDLPSPRRFALHLAHSLFPSSVTHVPSGGKFVYVCREPKDVLVSMWHFSLKIRSTEEPPMSFEQAFELFCEGVSEYGPYWEHVLGFWRASLEAPHKILFLKYEEMRKDPEENVRKLAEFMGVPISAEEEEGGMVEKIANLCSFNNFKNLEINKTGVLQTDIGAFENRHFFRKGEVGDWKHHLTEEMKTRIDHITEEKFRGSGLTVGETPK